jgi:hypothetical protein
VASDALEADLAAVSGELGQRRGRSLDRGGAFTLRGGL